MKISKEHIELFESILQKPISVILTDEHVKKEYRKYLRDKYKDEKDNLGEKDKYYWKDRVDNFEEMIGEKGTNIIKDLFSDVYFNEYPEMLTKSRLFAKQFADSEHFFEVEAWATEMNEYIGYVNAFLKTLDAISNSSK